MLGKDWVFLGLKKKKKCPVFSLLLQDYFFQDCQLAEISEKVQFITHQSSIQLFKYWSRHLHQHLSEKHLDTVKSPVVKGY